MKLRDSDLIELGSHYNGEYCSVVVITAREITIDDVRELYADYQLHLDGGAPHDDEVAFEEVVEKLGGEFGNLGWGAWLGSEEDWDGGDSPLACERLELPKKLNPAYFMYAVGGNLG